MNLDELLPKCRLLITAGSGGVGKTTTAAALGTRAALKGRRVAVLTIDPARRLANALGLSELTGTLKRVETQHFQRVGLAPKGELWAMMLDTRTTGDQMVRQFAPDPKTADAILANTYYQHFSSSLAGSQEYMAVEQVRRLTQDPRFDLVVLDTPPAVHALDFLDAPDRLMSALDSKAVQMLRASVSTSGGGMGARLARQGRELVMKGLNKLTGGPFLEDLSQFLAVFGSIIDALKLSSEAVKRLLRAETTRFLLVTAPDRSNVEEAIEFRKALNERGFPFAGFICNRVHRQCPELRDDDLRATQALVEALDANGLALPDDRRQALIDRMLVGLKSHNRMAERDRDSIQRLREVSGESPIQVPLFPKDVHDLSDLERIGRCLAAGASCGFGQPDHRPPLISLQ